MKLFPREAALAQIEPHDFSVARDNFGAPQVVLGPRAELVAGRHRIGPIALSMTHDRASASAVAVTQPAVIRVPLAGRLLYRLLPFRRSVVLANLRRVYGETLSEDDIVELAQAHYGHLWKLAGEFLRFRWLSRERQLALVRIESLDNFAAPYLQGKGVLLLTGHFGNWEVATVAGIGSFPQMRGRFHFVRRALKPDWFDRLVTRRFQRAGFGVLPKRGSLDAMLDRLTHGDAIVFAFDQHAQPPGRDRRSTSSARRHGRSRASPSSRSPPARRWCRRRAGANPTAGMCCASKRRLPRSSTRTPARRSG